MNWFDMIGERWEDERVDPGRIFEAHISLGGSFQKGVMVKAANHCKPGVAPKCCMDIECILVRELGTNREVSLSFRNISDIRMRYLLRKLI